MYQLGKTKNNQFFEKSIIPREILDSKCKYNKVEYN